MVKKIKLSLYGPGQAVRCRGSRGFENFWTVGTEGGQVVSPTDGSPIPTFYLFLLEDESIPGP